MWRSPSGSGTTRSASVTMPTQRPFLSTTGTPGSSLSWRARTTSSTFVFSDTVTGSRSITSWTRVAMRATLSSQAGGKPIDHVAGHDVVGAVAAGGLAPGTHVGERAQRRRLERPQVLGQQRADQPGEHVAGAGRGQGRGPARA